MVQFYPELKVGYTRIVTISTDNLLKTNEFRDGEGAQWPFLSDPERMLQRDLDIKEYTDPTNDPIAELWSDLRDITRRIRADWDITTPEMRAAWGRGEKERFFPYGQPFRDVWAEW